MTEHTPGPWKIGWLDENGQREVTSEYSEICICFHHSVKSIERQMEANARLIASAPELLAALEAVFNHLDTPQMSNLTCWKQASAAIAKARNPEDSKA